MRDTTRMNLKKIIALSLAIVLTFSLDYPALADNNNVSQNDIIIDANNTDDENNSDIVNDSDITGDSDKDAINTPDVEATEDKEEKEKSEDSDATKDDKAVISDTEDNTAVSGNGVSDNSSALSENEVSLDDSEDSNDMVSGEGDDPIITFSDDKFFNYVTSIYYNSFIFENQEDRELFNNHKVKQSVLDSFESLDFSYEYMDQCEMNHLKADLDSMTLGDISHFRNLKSLKIADRNNIDGLPVPKNLECLTIDNCKIARYENLNISQCSMLRELIYTNTRHFNGIEENFITGLSGCKTLNKAIFDGSEIKSLSFEASPSGDKKLIFSANNCTKLESIDFGGYILCNGYSDRLQTIQCAPSFKDCTKLQSLTINGIADKSGVQTLDITRCTGLTSLILNYKFTKADRVLAIKAEEIETTTGTFRVTREGNGKFKLVGFKNTFLYNYASKPENSDMFDLSGVQNKIVKFIVFEQDKDKFVKYEYWKPKNNDNIRNYSEKPICLKVGEMIKYNRPYFYNDEGVVLNVADSKISYNIEVLEKPEGKAGDYKVIKRNSDTGKSVVALNPGVAKFSYTVNNGGSTVTGSQLIYVYNPIESVSVTSDNTTEAKALEIDTSGDYYFNSIQTVRESSFLPNKNYAPGNISWRYEKKIGNNWVITSSPGLTLYKDENSVNNGVLNTRSLIRLEDNSVGGIFRAQAVSTDNYKISPDDGSSNTIDLLTSNTIYSTNYMYFKVKTTGLDSTELGYGYRATYFSEKPKAIYVEGPNLGAGYTFDVEILDTAEDKYSDFLETSRDVENTNKIKISFKGGLASADIYRYLLNLNNYNFVLKCITKKNGDEYKVENKTVSLSGMFVINYDEAGGTGYTKRVFYINNFNNLKKHNDPLEPIVKSGYDFAGWYSGDTRVVRCFEEPYGDKYLTAHWYERYNINYVLYGGVNNKSNPSGYNISSAVTFANPTRTGYTFLGWYSDSGFTKKVTGISKGSEGDKTFYAKWQVNTYKVKFNANGGKGKMKNATMTYDTIAALSKNKFTKKGKKFKGWALTKKAAKAGKVTYKNKAKVKNLSGNNGATVVLYAVWK